MANGATGNRDIVWKLRDGDLKRVCEIHPSYDALQYPLAFPFGNGGYSSYLRTVPKPNAQRGPQKVTQMQYYSYRIMVRVDNYLLKLRRLFQQFLIDVYCKIET